MPLHFNQLIDYLELRKIILANDGVAFDEHLLDMLGNCTEEKWIQERRIVSRIETRRGLDGEIYRTTASIRFPRCCEVFRRLCNVLSKEEFVELLFLPKFTRLAVGERSGFVTLPSDLTIDRLTPSFRRNHAVQLSDVVNPELLLELIDQVNQAPFEARSHGHLGEDDNVAFSPLLVVAMYVLTDPALMRQIERVVGLPPSTLQRFISRIYRMRPQIHEDSWHNDISRTQRRLVALSLQLSDRVLAGGNLLLRRKGRRRHFYGTPGSGVGEINFFRLAEQLEHKVKTVKGEKSRIVFAGWYCADSRFDYEEWVTRAVFPTESSMTRWLKWPFATH